MTEIVAYAVKDATGECYAIRPSQAEAEIAAEVGRAYLHGAETCGHPLAPGWVAERLPLQIVGLDAEEHADLLDEGTPTLDREP